MADELEQRERVKVYQEALAATLAELRAVRDDYTKLWKDWFHDRERISVVGAELQDDAFRKRLVRGDWADCVLAILREVEVARAEAPTR